MIFLYLFYLLHASPALAAEIVNTEQDFKNFLISIRELPQDQMKSAWQRFESKYQNIYDAIVYRKDEQGWQERSRKKQEAFFSELPSLQDKMLSLFAQAEKATQEQELKFRALFPDLNSNVKIYFLPSLFTFNGKVATLPGESASVVFFGIDSMAALNDDLSVLFSHEFFHAYHFQKTPPEKMWKTMASPLWVEGFGTYISGIFNPTASDEKLLMDPVLGQECKKPEFVKSIALQYLQILKSENEEYYKDWFTLSGNTQPKRRGYCLGLWLLRKIGENHTPAEMVVWNEDQFSQEISEAISKLTE